MKRSFSVYRSFTQNRAAFAVQPVGFGTDPIADPEVKYQIMPVQKYDKSQTSYITPVGAGCNAFAISAKCTEPEAATLVLDALARESYRTLRRTVFEACYHHTYGAESDALNVFELMLDTAGCDPGIFANGYSDAATAAAIRALRGGNLSSYNAAQRIPEQLRRRYQKSRREERLNRSNRKRQMRTGYVKGCAFFCTAPFSLLISTDFFISP